MKNVLILGCTGMLGHVLFKEMLRSQDLNVCGTVRTLGRIKNFFDSSEQERIIGSVEAENFDSVIKALSDSKPEVVINCIGIIKQLPSAKDPYTAITINSQFPHRLARFCELSNSRLIHISTDCIFDGKKGFYTESDISNATDLYGRTKFLGEVDRPHAVTLRTSIIGHELSSNVSLIDWFLSQTDVVKGYTKAIYSGFPTVEMARIIMEYVLPNEELYGVYQVSSEPISKYDLLNIVSKVYRKDIEITPYADFEIDRSLDSSRFREVTQYEPPQWQELIEKMHSHFSGEKCYQLRQG